MSNPYGDRTEDAVKHAVYGAHEKVDENTQASNAAIGEAADAVSDVVEKTADIAHAVLDSSRDNISAGLQKANATLNDVEDSAAEVIKKYPKRVVLIAATLGAVTGFMLGSARKR